MKTFVVSCFVLLILLGGIFFYHNVLDAASEELLVKIQSLKAAISDEDLSEAKDRGEGLLESWERAQKKFAVLIHHRQSDNINAVLARLKNRVGQKNWAEAEQELAHLKALIEIIPEQERVTLGNIF